LLLVGLGFREEKKGSRNSMYARNFIAKRRPSGWAERRRYFQHLIAQTRVALKNEALRKAASVIDKD
jgi:hypothetical protein